MYTYRIRSFYYDEEKQDYVHVSEDIWHEKQFTQQEFSKMCLEGLDIILDRYVYSLSDFLKEHYAFKTVQPKVTFDFEENKY